MSVSEDHFKELEQKIAELEQKVQVLQDGMLPRLLFNSVIKEQYNFELLKYLFEKFGIEKPKLKYQFGPWNAPGDENG